MKFEKQAAEAVNLLIENGVDFDIAIELVEKQASKVGEYARGVFSPTLMEHNIANKHGAKGPTGLGANVKAEAKGTSRILGRGLAEGAAGAGVGAALGAMAGKLKGGKLGVGARVASLIGASVGANAGYLHGATKSLSNQNKEMHKKYSEKQAAEAVNMLIENGIDFTTAVDMVEKQAAKMEHVNKMKDINMKPSTVKDLKRAGKIGGAVAAAGAVGYGAKKIVDKMREKKAAVDMLVENGMDFDTAISLVQAKSKELDLG